MVAMLDMGELDRDCDLEWIGVACLEWNGVPRLRDCEGEAVLVECILLGVQEVNTVDDWLAALLGS